LYLHDDHTCTSSRYVNFLQRRWCICRQIFVATCNAEPEPGIRERSVEGASQKLTGPSSPARDPAQGLEALKKSGKEENTKRGINCLHMCIHVCAGRQVRGHFGVRNFGELLLSIYGDVVYYPRIATGPTRTLAPWPVIPATHDPAHPHLQGSPLQGSPLPLHLYLYYSPCSVLVTPKISYTDAYCRSPEPVSSALLPYKYSAHAFAQVLSCTSTCTVT
jgi:hypothetical protein